MNLDKILAISGKPGLYVLKVQTRTGFVAESLLDGKKITVNLKSNVSLLSEISIYTHEGEKPLTEVMQKIAAKENKGQAISHKEDNSTLAAYFKEILPDYDEERVYVSDIKKLVKWYGILLGNAPEIFTEEVVKEEKEEVPKEEAKKEEPKEKTKSKSKKGN